MRSANCKYIKLKEAPLVYHSGVHSFLPPPSRANVKLALFLYAPVHAKCAK